MAPLVRQSSATLACVYSNFILLVILCVFNFTILANNLPVNTGYGIALILFSTIAAIMGTSQRSRRSRETSRRLARQEVQDIANK